MAGSRAPRGPGRPIGARRVPPQAAALASREAAVQRRGGRRRRGRFSPRRPSGGRGAMGARAPGRSPW
eukprot:7023155-Lingulodinium_polyedra.AAC.1